MEQKIVQINTRRSYTVRIGVPLAESGQLAKIVVPPCHVLIVTDSNVKELYLGTVLTSFVQAGYIVHTYVFSAGEQSKSIATLADVLEAMAAEGITSGDLVVALGGGVTGDLAGFAASVYCRGMRYLQIPTTFLAAIDSSVGGKTAVNLKNGKNLAGSFKQPEMVICALETFHTLPDAVFADGVAEGVKYGVLGSPALFKRFAKLDRTALMADMAVIVEECVRMKADIVEQDEFDTGTRQLLNFGHTIGHALEACSGYTVTHGKAVAVGMVLMTAAAIGRGLCTDESLLPALRQTLDKHHLLWRFPYAPEQVYSAALSDKKRKADTINIVIPEKLGQCRILPVGTNVLKEIIEEAVGQMQLGEVR